MKIKLTKAHKIGLLEKPEGTKLTVQPELGKQLIKEGVAVVVPEAKETKKETPKK